jgi:hypothetical protein
MALRLYYYTVAHPLTKLFLATTPSATTLSGCRICLSVKARSSQQDPPDLPKEVRRGNVEWLQTILSRFGPMTDRPQNQYVLDFEKPLVELDSRIREVKPKLKACTQIRHVHGDE